MLIFLTKIKYNIKSSNFYLINILRISKKIILIKTPFIMTI